MKKSINEILTYNKAKEEIRTNSNINTISFEESLFGYIDFKILGYITRCKSGNQEYFLTYGFDEKTSLFLESKEYHKIIPLFQKNITISKFDMFKQHLESIFNNFDLSQHGFIKKEVNIENEIFEEIDNIKQVFEEIEDIINDRIEKWYEGNINNLNKWLELKEQGFNCVNGNVEFSNRLISSLNSLKSLNLKKITGYFDISRNNINSLEGCPTFIGNYFNCSSNNLIDLKGCPNEIGGSFLCLNNKLKNLKYSPYIIKGIFNCANNKLESLEGCPIEVFKKFDCSKNKLTSLEHCPIEILGDFDCNNNKLESLEGCPKEVGGNFICYDNKRRFEKEEIFKICKVGGMIIN